MAIEHLSAAPGSIDILRRVMLWHGVLGERVGDLEPILNADDWWRFVVRNAFLLVPKSVFVTSNSVGPVKYLKPIIIEHLQALGVIIDEELIEIVKRLVDQLLLTERRLGSDFTIRKASVASLKARNQQRYIWLRDRQRGRCAICGIKLEVAKEELDHVIPFRLIGDVPDGSNWQLLCKSCNSAKSCFLSPLQYPECFNWIYRSVVDAANHPSNHTRFVALKTQGRCFTCGATAKQARLGVTRRCVNGLAVADNLAVVCESCCQSRKYVSDCDFEYTNQEAVEDD
jgi:hypothetical protein